MNVGNIAVSWFESNKNKSVDTYKIRANLKATKESTVKFVREDMVSVGDKYSNVMMKLSMFKLALAMVTLIVMAILFFTHLHVLDPVTLQFSRWATSPIICFITLVVVIKFVGLSIGLTLTLMSINQITFESIRVRLIGYCKPGLSCLLRKKVQHQRV